ncbi:MAG: 2-amino-4-oxopentanoate thiolase subunit OrtA [Patescibacteria group bacterium]
MGEDNVIPAGTWVEIERTVLAPGERAAGVPPETAAVPLAARVKGFLLAPAPVGGPARIRTAAGREAGGILREANPAYGHGFGRPVPELWTVGEEARKILGNVGIEA